MKPKCLQRERTVTFDRAECRAEVGRALFEADEIEQDEQIVEVVRVARPVFDQLGHARGFGEQQRQRGGVLGRPRAVGMGKAW